ncbi:hypothetical protein QTP88_029329 [Uroleucon formosanum]
MNQPDIILKCGFKGIKYDCDFKNDKGIKLFESGHVNSVTEIQQANGYSTITGFVIRQTSVNPSRYVTHCICECPAGAGLRCKHIGALIYYVNNEESVTKTNLEQEWGKPSKSGEAKYKKGRIIEDLFPKKKQKKSEVKSIAISHESLINYYNILEIPCILSKMIGKEPPLCDIAIECEKCLVELLDEVEESITTDFMYFIISKQNSFDINLSQIKGFYFPLNIKEHEFYMNNVVVDSKQIISINNQTKMQSESIQWKYIRQSRISASVKAHRIKICKDLSFENQEKLAKSLLIDRDLGHQGKINVAYGNKYESEAIEYYNTQFNNTILKCGVIVHSQKPWLCSSPDGIVIENETLTKVLEVKCPISCQSKPICDPENQKCNVPYLKYSNNKVVLSTTHQYYTQCQILMYCCGISECDLLVYNKIDPVVINIEKNVLFLQTILPRLEYFYFNFYLPKYILK